MFIGIKMVYKMQAYLERDDINVFKLLDYSLSILFIFLNRIDIFRIFDSLLHCIVKFFLPGSDF